MQGSWKHIDSRVQEYLSVFGAIVNRIERELSELLTRYSEHPLADGLAYALGGGKRLRPLITVLVYEALGEGEHSPYPASLTTELLHTISLVHDDIIDREAQRRGRKPFYRVFGVEKSLLLADFAFSIILDIAASYGMVKLLEPIARAAALMSEGEDLELQLLRRGRVTREEYERVISLKTASLFEASAELGALLSRRSYYATPAARFGWYLGMSYQLADDLEDTRRGRPGELLRLVHPPFTEESILQGIRKYSRLALEELAKLPGSAARRKLEMLAVTVV